jgi:hypothetical protein
MMGEHKEIRDFQAENHGFVEDAHTEKLPATNRAAVVEA